MEDLSDDLNSTAINYEKGAIKVGARGTGLVIKYALQSLLEKIRKGEVREKFGVKKLGELVPKSKQLKMIEITKRDRKMLDKLCKKYGVQYSIVTQKKGNLDFIYREEDSGRLEKALKEMISKESKKVEKTKDNIESKKDNIESKKDNIESKKDNIESKKDNIERRKDNIKEIQQILKDKKYKSKNQENKKGLDERLQKVKTQKTQKTQKPQIKKIKLPNKSR